MRRARITFEGAYHHVMNRGVKKEPIFYDNRAKAKFVSELRSSADKFGITIYAYCILDNHYHIVLKNTKNNLSGFMKELNGNYGIYYRKRNGGLGYVFQSRFKSTLIEDDSYLLVSMIYTLLNSVRAGKTFDPFQYKWSSIGEYYSSEESTITDKDFVEKIFSTKENMKRMLLEWLNRDIEVRISRAGTYMGSEEFLNESVKKYERRVDSKEHPNMRIKNVKQMEIKELLGKFEEKYNVKLKELKFNRKRDKQIRDKLIVFLKEEGNLTYKAINELPMFNNLQYMTISTIYLRYRHLHPSN